MEKNHNTKTYDLEDRTKKFAMDVRRFVRKLPHDVCNVEDGKQLVRSSGSVGANYIEANEAISKKDLILRIKIARKEAKESKYWLEVIEVGGELTKEKQRLEQEAKEIMYILSSIMRKCE